MVPNPTVAHNWANQNFERRYMQGSNFSGNEDSLYSYNTVIAQWLDKEKNVMAIIDKNLSPSTSKHVSCIRSAVRHDTTVFYFHYHPGWYNGGYDNVNVLGYRGEFGPAQRMDMIEKFIDNLYEQLRTILTSRSLSDEPDMKWWGYIQKLNELYRDASPLKWVRKKTHWATKDVKKKRITQKRKMVRAFVDGYSWEEVLDIVFGEGTYAAWQGRTEGIVKAAHKREWAWKVNEYLGLSRWSCNKLTSKQLKKMSGVELVTIKLRNLERDSLEYEIREKHRKESIIRAKKYIGIKQNPYSVHVDRITSAFTGKVIYDEGVRVLGYHPMRCYDRTIVCFGDKEFKDFCNAKNKKHWLERFYRIAELKQRRIIGRNLVMEIEAGKREISSLAEDELMMYSATVLRDSKIKEKRDMRLEKERRRKEELEAIKQQKIAEYLEMGIEGQRQMWRDKFAGIPSDIAYFSEFYFGGNILLRKYQDYGIETSKRIRVSLKAAEEIWNYVQKWHDDPASFESIQISTEYSGTYAIQSYANDIMVAGCHSIAYVEMERMAKELGFVA